MTVSIRKLISKISCMGSALSSASGKYDVFISFRGEDTRDNFTSHLFAALRRRNVKIFDDREMRRGEEISPTLSNAIEASKISVIIFSEDYASSKWCLNELLQILECKEKNGAIVIPVFYKVDPSDVSNQSGSFGDAFVGRERQDVVKWRAGLNEASRLPGLNSKEFRSEAQLVDKIVEDVVKKLNISTVSFDFHDLLVATKFFFF